MAASENANAINRLQQMIKQIHD
uniref:Uncharacterized protein n=1 Tax=Rhizophora mucronata TaxID=61149 RepID=A0A2P2J1X3_RHIMU